MTLGRFSLACAAVLGMGSAARSQSSAGTIAVQSYSNPIIFADYSDPDAIRVGEDFYMTSSSFESVPALPILHSHDLVHWSIVNHAIRKLGADFDVPQHGSGVWAPSLRFHNGFYYIYYGDPDRGIFMVKTRDIRGTWEAPVLVRAAKGWIDPCPLWDDDGNAYLVHAFANSRAGVKSILHVNRMSADGTKLLDDGTLVFDGHANHPTIEGPKFYMRNGWYYIFAPAGGVATGWQTVLRSKSVFGPYEDRVVMKQGTTTVNGPHQGAWVELANGEDWFLHFQDRAAFGRVVHLQPMQWRADGWPVIGLANADSTFGEPVLASRAPGVKHRGAAVVPQTSDEFSAGLLGVQWQWQANDRPEWMSLVERRGWLRLFGACCHAGTALSSSREAKPTEGPARDDANTINHAFLAPRNTDCCHPEQSEGSGVAVPGNSTYRSLASLETTALSREAKPTLSSSREAKPTLSSSREAKPTLSSSREAKPTEGPALAVTANALDSSTNLWTMPNVLLQKVPHSVFTATTRVDVRQLGDGAAGLVVLGTDYAFISVQKSGPQFMIVQGKVFDAPGAARHTSDSTTVAKALIDLRVRSSQTTCMFEFSTNGKPWTAIGSPFSMKAGRWVGAKIGLYVAGPNGHADFDYLRISGGGLN